MDELITAWSRIAWAQCWQVTLLIAGVWLVLRLVGRNLPHLACALWLVVLLKCVTPPLVSSPSGIFCWLQRERPVADEETVLAAAKYAAPVEPAGDAVVVRASPVVAAPRLPLRNVPTSLHPAETHTPIPKPGWSWPTLLLAGALAWLAGTVVYAAVALARWHLCWRKLCRTRQIEDPRLAGLLADLCRRLSLRRKVRLLITESPLGPAVVGLWRPTIVLPAAIVREKSPAELAPLVAHELIHIRRGDLWIGLLQTLAVASWWFHPLVRLASRLVTREAERCCDEETIAHLGCRSADYARSLLDVLALKQQLSPIPAFPGVRPVDVTSQRLERIMQLGQGCHKRTPWWCWLVMLAAAAAVLPGAALVGGAKEKPRPAADASQRPIRADFAVPSETESGNNEELTTRSYDVADLVASLGAQLNEPENKARHFLIHVVHSMVPGPWEYGEWIGVDPGDAAADPQHVRDVQLASDPTKSSLGWLDGKLVVRQSAEGHRRIEEQLAVLREHGHAELAVEVRIISGPKAELNAAEVDWRMIGGSQAEDPLPSDQKPLQPQLHPAGAALVRLVDDDSGRQEPSGAAVSVVQKSIPAMLALVDDAQAKKLIEASQSDRRTNILQAPKVTLFNGQSSRIEDVVQRPFVVGVTPATDGNKTALQPQIKLVSEGTTIRLRPVATKDGPIQLDFGLTLSQIRDVETVEFPAGPGKEPITVQVPEVAATRLNAAVKMNAEQTLVLSIPKMGKGKKEQPPLCVLVSVRKLHSQRADKTSQSATKATAEPPEQARAVAHPTKQFVFETSGWRLRFAPKDGGNLDVQQADAREPLANLRIRGGVYLDAAAEGKKKADRIQAEADAVQVTTRPASDGAPARLEISLEGNVRLSHNESQIEARRVVLQIDVDRQSPEIRVHVDEARSLGLKTPPTARRHVAPLAAGALVEKIYPVADLVIPVPTGPIKISSSGQMVKREPPAVTKPDFDSLIELIRTTIRPDSWDNIVGGRGEISVATNSYSLVIRQEESVHKQIADVLRQLRRLQDVQVVLTLQRLQLPAAELEKAAGDRESPLRPLVQDAKSRAWCLKPDSIATLTGLPGAKLQSGPKITTFNGQSVDLWLTDGEQQRDDLLTGLSLAPIVTSDFRSLRLQAFGDTTPPAEAADGAADKSRTSLDLATGSAPRPRQLPMELRELVLGQVLVVDESQYAWQENERGVPILDKLPETPRLFKNASARKPDTRHFYLITPSILVASEEEAGRVASPRKE